MHAAKMRLTTQAMKILAAELHTHQMRAIYFLRLGRAMPYSITKVDLTMIIAFLFKKLDWIEDITKSEEESEKYYPKCEIIEEIDQENLQEGKAFKKGGPSEFEANESNYNSNGPFIAKSNESMCKNISPDDETTIKIDDNPQPKEDMEPIANGENVTDEDEIEDYVVEISDEKNSDTIHPKVIELLQPPSVIEEKTFACSQCDKKFANRSNLWKHTRIHNGDRPFKCPQCDKKFAQTSHLKSHIRMHTGDKPFSCTHCKNRFTQRSNLKAHERIHTGDKPFRCSYCDKTFTDPSSLRVHLRNHTKDKPFNCSHCDKSFKQAGHLREHERVHTGDRPFNCSRCDKRFTQKTHLNAHERTHNDDKAFKCSHCKRGFNQKGDLKKHERIHNDLN